MRQQQHHAIALHGDPAQHADEVLDLRPMALVAAVGVRLVVEDHHHRRDHLDRGVEPAIDIGHHQLPGLGVLDRQRHVLACHRRDVERVGAVERDALGGADVARSGCRSRPRRPRPTGTAPAPAPHPCPATACPWCMPGPAAARSGSCPCRRHPTAGSRCAAASADRLSRNCRTGLGLRARSEPRTIGSTPPWPLAC